MSNHLSKMKIIHMNVNIVNNNQLANLRINVGTQLASTDAKTFSVFLQYVCFFVLVSYHKMHWCNPSLQLTDCINNALHSSCFLNVQLEMVKNAFPSSIPPHSLPAIDSPKCLESKKWWVRVMIPIEAIQELNCLNEVKRKEEEYIADDYVWRFWNM